LPLRHAASDSHGDLRVVADRHYRAVNDGGDEQERNDCAANTRKAEPSEMTRAIIRPRLSRLGHGGRLLGRYPKERIKLRHMTLVSR
jgi:hypothetical protein